MAIDLPLVSGYDEVLFGQRGAEVRRSVLPGGIRLVTERDPNVRSVSLGLWLPVGSRDEESRHAGSTHVLEHLLFKGTRKRTALQIATAFDEIGGESNAITAKEHTCYYGRVRSSDLPLALDVLCDMVTSPAFAQDAYAMEREVILEELAMAEDDPTDSGHEEFLRRVIGDNPLGRPVGGTPEIIRALDLEAVKQHYARHYGPDNLVVTAVGDVDHDEVADRLAQSLTEGGWELREGAAPRPRRAAVAELSGQLALPGGTGAELKHTRLVRDTEQTHVFVGGFGLSATDPRRNVLSTLQSILGGGMSSRLFQKVREEKGLAYSVYSFGSGYRESGVFGLYAACRPSRADEVASLMVAELESMAQPGGVSADEVRRSLGQMSGSLVLGLEDTASRMARLGSAELVHGKYRSVDEALQMIAAVEPQQVCDLAALLAANINTRVDVGPAAKA
ncbi:M16 family metallopeptidase [Dermabacteraceae bacterium P13115]